MIDEDTFIMTTFCSIPLLRMIIFLPWSFLISPPSRTRLLITNNKFNPKTTNHPLVLKKATINISASCILLCWPSFSCLSLTLFLSCSVSIKDHRLPQIEHHIFFRPIDDRLVSWCALWPQRRHTQSNARKRRRKSGNENESVCEGCLITRTRWLSSCSRRNVFLD